MHYMIIETFYQDKIKAMYQRFETNGRMLPDGVSYINSWIDAELTTCYQVMESDSPEKIAEWVSRWNDLVEFKIIPVITSAEAKEKIMGSLD